ncbi:atrial natriuretic peptide receptor 1-like [Glandiceps talaboti]
MVRPLVLWPCIVVLCLIATKGTGSNTVYKLGLLIPWDPAPGREYSGQTSAGAVTVATETIHKNETILPNITLEVLWRDTECDSKTAMVAAFDLVAENVSALIGPPCAEPAATVGMMASILNIPIVTWHGFTDVLSDKTVYTTLAKTYAPGNKYITAFLSMFHYYHWDVVGALAVSVDECVQGLEDMQDRMEPYNMTLTRKVLLSRTPSKVEIRDALRVIQNYARIILICTVHNEDLTRDIMIEAESLDMTKGEYVFIDGVLTVDLSNERSPWIRNDGRDDEAKLSFQALFTFTYMARTNNDTYYDFIDEVRKKTAESPFFYAMEPEQEVDYFAGFLHDAVILYALALHDVLESGGSASDGEDVFTAMTFQQFKGITGRVATDVQADREPDFCIFHLQNNDYEVVAFAFNVEQMYEEKPDIQIIWPGGSLIPPPAVPECGFRGCPFDYSKFTVSVLLPLIIIILLFIILIILWRRRRRDRDILSMLWRVRYEDIQIGFPASASLTGSKFAKLTGLASRKRLGIESRSTMNGHFPSLTSFSANQNQLFAPIGTYKSTVVTIKTLNPKHFKLTRDLLKDLNTLRQLQHDNINPFVGAVPDGDHACTLMHYCARGSLMDIIQNDDIKVDKMFKVSFSTDIVKGMEHLHKSRIHSHGNLKSSNCVVDSRWVVKVTDFGILKTDLDDDSMSEYQYHRNLLWTAPELLRMENNRPMKGSQKGDVYSYGIILQELAYRSEPYYMNEEEPKAIIEQVKMKNNPPYRPYMPIEADDLGDVQRLILACWTEDPEQRIDFPGIRKKLMVINKGRKTHILDNMIDMMEAYTNNLEEIVAERTEQLLQEKKKTDTLLYRMLPQSVADQLKMGQMVSAENFDGVSIFFSDIVGFTTIAASSTPMQVVAFLNDLYITFDSLIEQFDVYKVETIGDAYMVVSGLPVPNGDRHSAEIASLALDMLSCTLDFKIRHMPERQLQIRVGLHTGAVVAGVVGVAMPRYCLFGDTVNMASRMESHGKALRIHISSKYNETLVQNFSEFETKLRGDILVKSKGMQTTYWLVGKKGYDKKLPKWERDSCDSSDSAVASMKADSYVTIPGKQDLNVQKRPSETKMATKDDKTIVVPGNPTNNGSAVSGKPITRKFGTSNKVYPTTDNTMSRSKTTLSMTMSISEV